ncbi:MAG: PEP-CTERM sorting domain-containing protein, partial [Pirellulaceae bacterium]
LRGDGSLDGERLSGLFSMDIEEGYFSIDLSSPYTTQQGSLYIGVDGGLVTTSTDSGMFDGLLPALGTPGNFGFLLPYFVLDYDFGNFNGHDLEIVASFSGSGAALAGVPEPGTILVVSSGMLGMMLRRRRAQKLAASQV